jgi:hypothetical protein
LHFLIDGLFMLIYQKRLVIIFSPDTIFKQVKI